VEIPDQAAISQETAWAYEVVVGIRSATPPVTRDFAGGVEEALMWLTGSDCPPVPAPGLEEPTTESVRLLPADRFEALHEAMTMEQAHPPAHWDGDDLAILEGIIAATEWLLGKRQRCPVVGTAAPASGAQVAAADTAIDEAMSELPMNDARRFCAYGVGITLTWALGRSSQVPCVY
jgi:hypothetical protein